jgi:hypothetical protein
VTNGRRACEPRSEFGAGVLSQSEWFFRSSGGGQWIRKGGAPPVQAVHIPPVGFEQLIFVVGRLGRAGQSKLRETQASLDTYTYRYSMYILIIESLCTS